MNHPVAGASPEKRLAYLEERLADVERRLAYETLTRRKYIEQTNAEFSRLWARINQERS